MSEGYGFETHESIQTIEGPHLSRHPKSRLNVFKLVPGLTGFYRPVPAFGDDMIGMKETIDVCVGGCVTTNGTFDVLHAGHVDLFRLCRSIAEGSGLWFVVGLNSDESVKRYKGPDRPRVGENLRAEMVLETSGADAVVIYDEDTPERLLSYLRPAYHVNDAKYGEQCVERGVLDACGTALVMLSQRRELSSTAILDKT